MNPDKLIPWKVARWGGLVNWDDPTQLPNGIALIAQNVRFLADSVQTRWGLQLALEYVGIIGGVTGFDFLNVLGVPNVAAISAIFSDAGMLFSESPAGSGTLVPLASPALPTGAAMQTAKAYNRIFMVFSNLLASLGESLVYDAATGVVQAVTPNVVGAPWTPGILYMVGDLVKPKGANGRWFRCTSPGIASATEPIWPTLDGYFNQDGYIPPTAADLFGGQSQWEEWTPAAQIYLPQVPTPVAVTDNPGAGTIAAGQDVYAMFAWVCLNREGPRSTPVAFINTQANDQVLYHFQNTGDIPGPPTFPEGGPRMPRWMAEVILNDPANTPPGQTVYFVGFSLNVYVAAVATGAPAPAATAYKFYQAAPVSAGPIQISLIPVVVPSASPAGTVVLETDPGDMPGIFTGEFGTRNMIVLREDTNGAITPVDPGAVIAVQFGGGVAVPFYYFLQRDNSGLVTAGILASAATASFVVGLQVTVANVTVPFTGVPDPTFNGVFVLLSVTPIGSTDIHLTWQTTVTGTPQNYSAPGGTVAVSASPQPVAFLPPGGPNTKFSIAAFATVDTGAAGPFFYLTSPEPAEPFVASILKLDRFQGIVTATVNNGASFAVGNTLIIMGAADGTFDGAFVLGIINGNVLTWTQVGVSDSSAGTGGTVSISQILPTEAASGAYFPLNFDDTSLPQGVDVTDELNAIIAPPSIDISYIPSTRRMCFVSDKFPSSLVLSEPDEPWHIDGDNAVLGVDTSNGQVMCGAREVGNGQIVALKRRGGYQVVPTADVPAAWGVSRLWSKHGPASARGIGKTENGDTLLDFVVFVDPDSGLYKYPATLAGSADGLDWLSWELTKGQGATWDRVNREAAEQIWVVVDDVAREIKLGLPLDGATTPSHILTMNYFNGWDPPLQQTFSGEWVYSRSARRWSLDPVATRCAGLADRTLAVPIDSRVNTRQLLYGVGGLITTVQAIVEEVNYFVESMAPPPTLPFGTYYAQIAAVKNGQEISYSPIFGPFQVALQFDPVTHLQYYTLFQLLNELTSGQPDTWKIYFGSAPDALTQVLSTAGTDTAFVVTRSGTSAATPNGNVTIDFQQPDVHNDHGLGIDSQYQPAFVTDPLLSLLRFALITGEAKGAGDLFLMPMNDNNVFLSAAKLVDLDDGNNVHFKLTLRPPSDEHLALLLANSDVVNGIPPVPGAWFELHDLIIWYRKLWPSRRK